MSDKNIQNISANANPHIGSSLGTSATLHGAKPIENPASGQARQPKFKKLSDVNRELRAALPHYEEGAKILEEVKPVLVTCVANYSFPVNTHIEEAERAYYEKQLVPGQQAVAIYQRVVEQYDQALSKVNLISPAVKIERKAASGIKGQLEKLGLENPTAGTLLRKLQDMRSAAYDTMVRARAWNDYAEAKLMTIDGNEITRKMEELRKEQLDQASPTSNASGDQKTYTNVAMQLQRRKHFQKSVDAEKKLESSIKGFDAVPYKTALPDGQDVTAFISDVVGMLVNVKKANIENYMVPTSTIASMSFVQAQNQLDNAWMSGVLKTSKDKSDRIASVLDTAKTARKQALAVFDYIDKTIDVYDKALTMPSKFHEAGLKKLSNDGQGYRDKAATYLRQVFNFHDAELGLYLRVKADVHGKELRASLEDFRLTQRKLAILHTACCDTLAGRAPTEKVQIVPDRLLHKVLTELAAKYEDTEIQVRFLLKQLEEKGKGTPHNEQVLASMRELADSLPKMRALIDSQLGRIESSGKTGKGTVEEAQAWIKETLRKHYPQDYAGTDTVEDITETMEEFNVDEPAAPGASTHAPAQPKAPVKKGPTPPQLDPAKELDKAIAAADNANADSKTVEELKLLEAQSKKYSNNARAAAQSDASPKTIEEYMELAAEQESKLVAKKTKILKKFEKALGKMNTAHKKYEEYADAVNYLTDEVARHRENREAFLQEGKTLRIRVSKELDPTHSLFHFLCDNGEVRRVTLKEREEIDSVDEHGKSRRDPRTTALIKDFIDEYEIHLHGGKKFVAHFHYKNRDADVKDFTACHFKTWEQRHRGKQYEIREEKEGRDTAVHRGRTNLDSLNRLQHLAGGNNQ